MRKPFVCVAVLAALAIPVVAAGGAALANGSFETGDTSGWSTAAVAGSGLWSVNDGSPLPQSGHGSIAPAQGTFNAVCRPVQPELGCSLPGRCRPGRRPAVVRVRVQQPVGQLDDERGESLQH